MADFSLKSLIGRLWRREGYYSNHPADMGGETYLGISRRAFPELWVDGPPSPAKAERVYETVFYTSPGLEQIPDPHLREQMFDFGVNAGPVQAIKLLQILVGTAPDGKLGPKTLAAIPNYPSSTLYGVPISSTLALNLAYEAARVLYYAKLVRKDPSQAAFINGWLARAVSLRSV